jgi:ribonuclease-3
MARLISLLWQYFFPSKDPTIIRFQEAIAAITTYMPHNLALYRLALRHSSIKDSLDSNERLEFLGDAVLSLVVATYLFKKYPRQEEGFLTEIRSRVVNRNSINELAKKVGLDTLLIYDTHSVKGDHMKSIYGNALEAFIGALYMDHGYQACVKFIVDKLLKVHIDLDTLIITDDNYKSKLVAWAQKNRKRIHFQLVSEKLIKNQREFLVQVSLDGEVKGEGTGKTKKQAEQMAAEQTLQKLSMVTWPVHVMRE